MDWEEEIDPFNLQTLKTLSRYKATQKEIPMVVEEQLDQTMSELVEEIEFEEKESKKYNVYSDKQKASSSCGLLWIVT